MTDQYSTPWLAIHDELGVSPIDYDDRPISAYVAQYAEELPQATALRFLTRDITYLELDTWANQLANVLVENGVSKGDVVGFHMPNIPQYIVGLVAVSKIGCAGSGVSPLLAPGELQYQIEDAGISVLLSLDDLTNATVAQIDTQPECLRTVIVTTAADHIAPGTPILPSLAGVQSVAYADLMANASDQFEQRDVHWNDTFMVQYTGGTTGRPKGAMVSVRNLMHNCEAGMVYLPYDIGTETVATAFPFFHAAGLCLSCVGLRNAARVLLIPNPRDIEHFCQQMQACPPTRLAAVPTLYQMLLNHPGVSEVDFSMVKTAASGAAPLSSDDRIEIEKLIGANKVMDVFGMTETGPVHVVNPPGRSKPTSIGIPVPGMETRIVDLETGTEEMPLGEPGEIVTSGPQVMKGYLNLPDESAKALREWRGKTWMYTGDVGFMDEEGYISLCDRAKDMLIVGGFKVFSVELEDKLSAMECIAQTAVVGTPDTKRSGNDIVTLFVQTTEEAQQRQAEEIKQEITDFCRTNMSAYKVPKQIHIIDEIPVTPVGKIDKKLLREQAKTIAVQ